MPLFGYVKQPSSVVDVQELKEVTFDIPLSDLRRIAAFLIDCADRAEVGKWRSNHRHIDEFDPSWAKDHSNVEVIVIHPSPEPPKVVSIVNPR